MDNCFRGSQHPGVASRMFRESGDQDLEELMHRPGVAMTPKFGNLERERMQSFTAFELSSKHVQPNKSINYGFIRAQDSFTSMVSLCLSP